MSDSKRIMKAIVAGVLVIGIVIAGSCSKSPDKKPVDTLFVIDVDNLEFTLSQMNTRSWARPWPLWPGKSWDNSLDFLKVAAAFKLRKTIHAG